MRGMKKPKKCPAYTCGIPSENCDLPRGHKGKHHTAWTCCNAEYECEWVDLDEKKKE
jgi:hypothetical protein